MRLLLVRHGEAWEEGTQPGRPLTPRGEEEARRAGRYLARMGASPSAFWCSPKLRAEQTAVRLGACLGDRHPQRRPDLEPDADPAHAQPRALWVRTSGPGGGSCCRFALNPPRPLLVNLRAADVLMAVGGNIGQQRAPQRRLPAVVVRQRPPLPVRLRQAIAPGLPVGQPVGAVHLVLVKQFRQLAGQLKQLAAVVVADQKTAQHGKLRPGA